MKDKNELLTIMAQSNNIDRTMLRQRVNEACVQSAKAGNFHIIIRGDDKGDLQISKLEYELLLPILDETDIAYMDDAEQIIVYWSRYFDEAIMNNTIEFSTDIKDTGLFCSSCLLDDNDDLHCVAFHVEDMYFKKNHYIVFVNSDKNKSDILNDINVPITENVKMYRCDSAENIKTKINDVLVDMTKNSSILLHNEFYYNKNNVGKLNDMVSEIVK